GRDGRHGPRKADLPRRLTAGDEADAAGIGRQVTENGPDDTGTERDSKTRDDSGRAPDPSGA
ncbi:MAG: hypothetical protein ACRDQ6_20355, partial [Pseudonocardiaceae bacterium]